MRVLATTLIHYLDSHAGALSASLTAVLIVVTGFYAWQNRRMVKEMKLSREAAIRPKLGLDFLRLGPTAMTVAIRNVGPGPAFDIDVRLSYEPRDAETDPVEQPWRYAVLGPGEQRDLMPPGELNDNLNALALIYRQVRLTGTVKDMNGQTHPVDEVIDDLAEWRETLRQARQRWVDQSAERRLAEELSKKLGGPLDGIASQIGHLAAVVESTAELPPEQGNDT